MQPCPHCAGGVWVVRNASCSGKRGLPVFACKEQKNLPLSTRKQDNALRETDAILSSRVCTEDATLSSAESQNFLSNVIPTWAREDSPEIEYRPLVLCLPVAKTHGKDRTPNSVPFETSVRADKRHEHGIQGVLAPLKFQPPGAVDDRLWINVSALSTGTTNVNKKSLKCRDKRKRKLRRSSRKRIKQLDFVEDDSDADPDWAPGKGSDFRRTDSENDFFSDDDSASDNDCPKRKRRNANWRRKLLCAETAESSLGNGTENERTLSRHKTTNQVFPSCPAEAVTPTTNFGTAKPTPEHLPITTEGANNCKNLRNTVETVPKTVKSGLQKPRAKRVTIGPVCPEDGSDWMPDITSDDDDSASEYACPGHKAGSADSCRKSTHTPGTLGNRKSNAGTGYEKERRTVVPSKQPTESLPQPKIQRSTVGSAPGQCPVCGKQCPNIALHVRQRHLQSRKNSLVLAPQEAELGLVHLENTGSFGYCCCGCYYPNKASLELHQTVHRPDPVESAERECPCCEFVAENFGDLVRHTSQHALDKEADKICFLCGWIGTDLFCHWHDNHPALKGTGSDKTTITAAYITASGLKDTIKRSHKFKCYLCRNRYRSREGLNGHVREIHPSVESRQSSIEYMQKTGFISYYCPTCVRYFPSRKLLDLHDLSHSPVDIQGERPERQCPACTFVGIDFSSVLQHVMTHSVKYTGKKQCLFCSDQRVSLWQHYTRVHPEFRDLISKDWQYQCEKCVHKLKTEHSLKQHVRAMHGTFQCLYCALRLHSGVKLGQHIRAEHTKDGGLPCPFCPKVYARYKQVSKHYQKRHDIRQVVVCDVCQHVFRNKILHKRHFMAKHSSEHRFACKQCGKKYQTSILLDQHVVRHHKWTEADRKKFNDRQKERRAAHKKKALKKDSDGAGE